MLKYLLCLFLVTSYPVYAARDIENADLSRIHSILLSLTPLIQEAAREQEPNDRLNFHYDWLMSDINKIEKGIQEKLHQSPFQLYPVKPIKGDYIP